MDEYARASLIFPKSGSTWDPEKSISSYPYRGYDLIEFFKICAKKKEIIGIEIDVSDHIISFLFQDKEILKDG